MNNKHGIAYALAAYLLWGAFPLYFKLIIQVPAPDILCHRIIWSFVLLAAMLFFRRQFSVFRNILIQPKKAFLLLASSLFIAVNWGTYIWAVNNGHMLDASLGYFINPLVSVCFGVFFLKERLIGKQWIAILLATAGVLIQVVKLGTLPWVALILAFSFAFYGLIRKKANVEAQGGLFIETLVLLPVALFYLCFVTEDPTADLTRNTFTLNLILMSAGIVTTVPLLFFNAAATKVPLTILGFIQYITPSIVFIMAIFLYQEPVHTENLITFGFIWGALFIYSCEALRVYGREKKTEISA